MNQVATLDPSNAPRDLAQLTHKGRFQIRTLATALGILEDPEKKAAFMGFNTEQQAKVVLDALQAADAGGGAAAPAAAPAPENKLRKPSNKALDQAAAPAAQAGGNLNITPVMDALAAVLKEVQTVRANQVELYTQVANMRNLLGTVATIGLLLGEQSLGAERTEILKVAFEDVAMVLAQVDEVLGKAKKG